MEINDPDWQQKPIEIYETTNFLLFSLNYQFARDRRALPLFCVRLAIP